MAAESNLNRKKRVTKTLSAARLEENPQWGLLDVLLWAGGLWLLVRVLYYLVLNGFLRAQTAGLTVDIPGQLGILYLVLRIRHRREPWAALGWTRPTRSFYWGVAVAGGALLGAIVMAIENSERLRLQFHDIWYAVIFGGIIAALIEETVFRGMILPVVWRWVKDPITAAVLTAIVFALYHGLYKSLPAPTTLLWLTLTGTAYGVIRIKSQSTFTSALMHACYNLTLFVWQGA